MRVQLIIPNDLLEKIDIFCKDHYTTRSAFFRAAALQALRIMNNDEIKKTDHEPTKI